MYEGNFPEREAARPITDGQVAAFQTAVKILQKYVFGHPEARAAITVLQAMLDSGQVDLYRGGNLEAMKNASRFLTDYKTFRNGGKSVVVALREIDALVKWYSA